MDTQYFVWAGLAVLVVASLVIAYYSTRTWNVGHVVLVYLVFLAAGLCVYLSTKTLNIRQVYGQQAAKFEKKFDDLRKDNVQQTAAIDKTRHELHKITFDRGGVWRHCRLANATDDGTVTLQIDEPKPHGLNKDTTLLVFEEQPVDQDAQAARYLGEFKVTSVDPAAQTATLAPATRMEDDARQALAASKLPWSLYEVMPVDRHGLAADIGDEQIKKTVPPGSQAEYLRDGTVAKDDDPDEHVIGIMQDGSWQSMEVLRDDPEKLGQVVEKRFVRQLRAYQYLFRELGRQRAVDLDAIAAVQRDAEQLKQALARAKKDIAYREAEKGKLDADLKGFEFERDVVTHHLRAITAQFANVKAALADVQRDNSALARQLATLQLEAAGQADGRTGALPARERAAGTVR